MMSPNVIEKLDESYQACDQPIDLEASSRNHFSESLQSYQTEICNLITRKLQSLEATELQTAIGHLKADLLNYLIEIKRQIAIFEPAVSAAKQLDTLTITPTNLSADRATDIQIIQTQIKRMSQLFEQCASQPLSLLTELGSCQADFINQPPTTMPGYDLDRPRPDATTSKQSELDNLAKLYLLPINFAEREESAMTAHQACWRVRQHLRQTKSDKLWQKINESLYIIDATFITLWHDLRLKQPN